MSKFVKTVLDRPVAVIVSVMALILFGISSITGMSLELYPETSYPMLFVSTFYAGAGPDEVEKLVTEKIEESCGTISGLKQMTSTSSENFSEVTFQFKYGTDLNVARAALQEAIENAKEEFPEGVKSPTIVAMNGNSDACISLALDSENAKSLLSTVKQKIVPELKKVNEIASVKYWGGNEEYISIEIYPERVIQYGLSVADIADKITASNFVNTAGQVLYGSQQVNMDTRLEYGNIDAIRNISIPIGNGEVIHVSDVANVHYAEANPVSYSRFNGKESVTIDITKKQKANIITLSKNVKDIIEKLSVEYPDIKINVVYDTSESIVASIKSIAETLVLGVLLSMLVLFLFFGDIKASLIVGSSMPVSLLATFICMGKMGFTLNMITMSALVIGIGMMVDNSIVVIEMCFRKSEDKLSFNEAAYEGTKVVIGSIVASTLTTVVVYLPLTGLQGMSGQLYSSLGYTIVFALVASLFSAIALVPICFSTYKPKEKKDIPINRILDKLGVWYKKIIVKVLNRKIVISLMTIALLLVSLYLATFLKTELMESSDARQISLDMTFKPGTGLDQMDEISRHVEEFAASKSEVSNYSTTVSKETANATVNAYIDKKCKTSIEQLVNEWNEELAGFDARCNIKASKADPEGMGELGSDTYKEVVLRSASLNELKDGLKLVEDLAAKTPGVLIVQNSYSQGGIKAEIKINPEYAQTYGFDITNLADTISDSISGKKALNVTVGDTKYEAKVELPKELRDDIDAVNNLIITNDKNESVPLSQLATITFKDNPLSITRNDGQFEGTVKITLAKNTAESTSATIDKAVAGLTFPSGVKLCESSLEESMEDEFSGLGKAIGAAIFLVFMVMAIQFESVKNSLLVMFCMPFSLIGAIGLLFVTQSKISMTTLMGFLMLAGIVVNNGILYVDTTNQYKVDMDLETALAEAGSSRMRPIFMTTMTTILSMVPMCIPRTGGGDSMKGMALVIIGGLITSTILTLILLPTFYLIINGNNSGNDRKKENKELIIEDISDDWYSTV